MADEMSSLNDWAPFPGPGLRLGVWHGPAAPHHDVALQRNPRSRTHSIPVCQCPPQSSESATVVLTHLVLHQPPDCAWVTPGLLEHQCPAPPPLPYHQPQPGPHPEHLRGPSRYRCCCGVVWMSRPQRCRYLFPHFVLVLFLPPHLGECVYVCECV